MDKRRLPNLEGILRHHLDPQGMRAAWTRDMAALPPVPWLEEIDFVIRKSDRLKWRDKAKIVLSPAR